MKEIGILGGGGGGVCQNLWKKTRISNGVKSKKWKIPGGRGGVQFFFVFVWKMI